MPKKKVKVAPKKQYSPDRKLWLLVAAIILVIIGVWIIKQNQPAHPMIMMSPVTQPPQTAPMTFDFNNQKLTLDDQNWMFKGGHSTDSATSDMASIANQSLSSSGKQGAAIMIDNPGGSGTFYYLLGAISMGGKDIYSRPILLGDRIKIQSITVSDAFMHDNGMITVKYLDRAANAPMSDKPTVQQTVKYAFGDDGNLIKVLH